MSPILASISENETQDSSISLQSLDKCLCGDTVSSAHFSQNAYSLFIFSWIFVATSLTTKATPIPKFKSLLQSMELLQLFKGRLLRV